MKKLFVRFVREEEGQDLIEYSLLAALIALAAVITMTQLGKDVSAIFGKVSGKLTTAAP